MSYKVSPLQTKPFSPLSTQAPSHTDTPPLHLQPMVPDRLLGQAMLCLDLAFLSLCTAAQLCVVIQDQSEGSWPWLTVYLKLCCGEACRVYRDTLAHFFP